MSAPKFTPGPWSCSLYKYTDAPGSIYAADNFEVASTQGVACHHKKRTEKKNRETIDRETLVDRANAALIAAAPEMYEALEKMLRRYPPMLDGACHSGICPIEECKSCGDSILAERALAKARGAP